LSSDTSIQLFDHFVGKDEQRFRGGEAQRLGGLEIDRQLELGWLRYCRGGTPL
jgi:hypothetical protein